MEIPQQADLCEILLKYGMEGAENRLNHALSRFRGHMEQMLQVYRASREEMQALGLYA